MTAPVCSIKAVQADSSSLQTKIIRQDDVLRSLRDMLYRRRMERQLAQARGLMSGEGKMPPPEDDVS